VVKIGGLQFTTGGDAAKVHVDGSRAEEEPGCGFLASGACSDDAGDLVLWGGAAVRALGRGTKASRRWHAAQSGAFSPRVCAEPLEQFVRGAQVLPSLARPLGSAQYGVEEGARSSRSRWVTSS
jgi:hypothetical protein